MMPGMDGFELCREIRSSIVLNHIPIIIITAKSEDVDKVQGLEAGADAYLLKPFNSDELHVRIAKLLEQRRVLREKYSRALRNNCPESAGERQAASGRPGLHGPVDGYRLLPALRHGPQF